MLPSSSLIDSEEGLISAEDHQLLTSCRLEEMTPTDRLSGYGVPLLRVENGKIAEARIYFDQLVQMSQLGLIPAPAAV